MLSNSYDVVIVGGGIAGCSAALAAKRHGKTVLLIEKLTVLGGLATTGHITIYLPLDDGYGNQVIGGISEELLKLSSKYAYYGKDFQKWKEEGKRYECKFNGPAFSLALEEFLLQTGVEILYDTLFVGSEINEGLCQGVFVENKSGRSFIPCSALIDASGDADVFVRQGESWEKEANSLAMWLYSTDKTGFGHQLRGGADAPGIHLVSIGRVDVSKAKQEIVVPYYGDTAENINRFLIDGHQRVLALMKENPLFTPASLPGIAQIRMARRLCGQYELSDKDANLHFEDNIGGTGDWRKPGPVYEIPFRTLISENLKNVLAAGRCISTSGEAWEIIRCIPQAALTGQVAGTAAVLLIEKNLSVQDIDIIELRRILCEDKVILDVNKGRKK